MVAPEEMLEALSPPPSTPEVQITLDTAQALKAGAVRVPTSEPP
jgi:hypothetical protein